MNQGGTSERFDGDEIAGAGQGVDWPADDPPGVYGDGPGWDADWDSVGWLDGSATVEPEPPRAGRAKELVRELVETGMLALLVFLVIRATFQNFQVDGESMFPTLHDGEFVIVDRLVYADVDMEGLGGVVPWIDAKPGERRHLFHGPQRGDIIVVRAPWDTSQDLIKRVIGLPGETLEIRGGVVFIDGVAIDEPYITSACERNCDYAAIVIPEREYFVMGDNRNNSRDSRDPATGLIREELIIGKARISYWPLSAFGLR